MAFTPRSSREIWADRPITVNRELGHPGVLGQDVLGPIRLGHDRRVRPHAGAEEVDGADPALELPHDARDQHVAAERDASAPGGHRGHDHRRHARLHVEDPGSVEAVALDGGRPGIANPPSRDRVDVEVAVEHQASPVPGAGKPSEGLEATGVDLLELGLEPLAPEEAVEEPRDRCLVRRVAGDADQVLCEVHDLIGDQRGQDAVLRGLAHPGRQGGVGAGAVSRARGSAGASSSGCRRRSAGTPRSRSRPRRPPGRRAARPSRRRC